MSIPTTVGGLVTIVPSRSGPESGDREDNTRFRPAMIGDTGVVAGEDSQAGSGLTALAIRIAPDQIAYLVGEWRCIHTIATELDGQQVEVIEAEGSAWGFHDVLPLNEDQ